MKPLDTKATLDLLRLHNALQRKHFIRVPAGRWMWIKKPLGAKYGPETWTRAWLQHATQENRDPSCMFGDYDMGAGRIGWAYINLNFPEGKLDLHSCMNGTVEYEQWRLVNPDMIDIDVSDL